MRSNIHISKLLEDAWIQRGQGNYTESKRLLVEAQKLCDPTNFDALGRIYHIYMQHEFDRSNLKKALEFNSKSISFYHKTGNKNKIAHSTRHRADLLQELGDEKSSEESYLLSIEIYRNINETNTGDYANALRGYALILEKKNQIEVAVQIWIEIKAIYSNHSFAEGIKEAEEHVNRLNQIL